MKSFYPSNEKDSKIHILKTEIENTIQFNMPKKIIKKIKAGKKQYLRIKNEIKISNKESGYPQFEFKMKNFHQSFESQNSNLNLKKMKTKDEMIMRSRRLSKNFFYLGKQSNTKETPKHDINDLKTQEDIKLLQNNKDSKTPSNKLTIFMNGSHIMRRQSLEFLLKVYKKDKEYEKILKKLRKNSKSLISLFLFKKNMISEYIAKNWILDNSNQIKFDPFYINDESCSNILGLIETILNQCIRVCFEKWFQKQNITFSNSFEGNESFWKQVYLEVITLKKIKFFDFKKFYDHISKNYQIKKKKLKNYNKINSTIRVKYLNIIIDCSLQQHMMSLLKNYKPFSESYNQMKNYIFDQFSVDSETEESDEENQKFHLNLKSNIKKALDNIIKYLKKKPTSIDASFLKYFKKKTRNIKVPATLNDYKRAFSRIENA